MASYGAGRAVDELGERPVLVGGGIGLGLCVLVAVLLPMPGLVVMFVAAGLWLPAGVALVAAAEGDWDLLDVGAALQRMTSWHERRPPLAT